MLINYMVGYIGLNLRTIWAVTPNSLIELGE
jgi:hypothetical protein